MKTAVKGRYNDEQSRLLKLELLKGKRSKDIAKSYSKKWNRSYESLVVKLVSLKRELNLPVRKKAVNSEVMKPIVRKKSTKMKLDIKPTRIVVFKNHIKMYF